MADLIERDKAIDAVRRSEALDRAFGYGHAVDALRELPSAQPYTEEEIQKMQDLEQAELDKAFELGKQDAQSEPQWIPCSKPPEESGTYIVTAHDGINKRVTFVKYQKTLKQWDLNGRRAYWRIFAYKPLPEPWRGEEHGTTL